MSKPPGNVINPNDIVNEFIADTLRLRIMFISRFGKVAPWSSNAIKG
jgi:leucyl-tRNA synthetase